MLIFKTLYGCYLKLLFERHPVETMLKTDNTDNILEHFDLCLGLVLFTDIDVNLSTNIVLHHKVFENCKK